MNNWELDFTEDTPDSFDQPHAPTGWHLCVIESIKEDAKTADMVFTFRVESQPAKGTKHTHKLQSPAFCEKEEWIAIRTKIAKVWADRLRLVAKDQFGKVVGVAWSTAVGKTVVLKIKEREYSNANTGKSGVVREIDWAPYSTDHPDIPPAERVRMGLKLLEGQTLAQPGEADKKNGAAATKGGRGKKAEQAPRPEPTEADLADLASI